MAAPSLAHLTSRREMIVLPWSSSGLLCWGGRHAKSPRRFPFVVPGQASAAQDLQWLLAAEPQAAAVALAMFA